jgi:tetratricopeptide (TPR) repeat protein
MRRMTRAFTMFSVAAATALAVTVSPLVHADESGGARAGATDGDRERARALFIEGNEYFDEGSYDEALPRFEESYRLVPSPNSRLMKARTLRKMGRVREAWAEFEVVLEEAKKAAAESERYLPTLESAERERADLRASVGLLTVEVEGEAPDDAVLMIAGRQAPRSAWGRVQAVSPGSIDVVLVAPSVEKFEKSVEIAAGGEETITVEVRNVPQAERAEAPVKGDNRDTLLTMAYVSGGVGIGGLALFGIVLATDGNDALAVTGLAMGAVGLGLGIALYALAQDSEASGPRATLVAGPGSVSVVGSF